ncbi:MFS transporter [Caballeronia novacaledonica]|uniref:MFS transporter n=1 Tax=Caballeronia novacaledonica TaxID=1544861 RepID=A0AA37MT75_9BURK|nr:MFS transporter [Caballeronia novacaledonica]GJH27014.1 MFS transporter [Caballeronia novacaledonica]
MENFAALDAGEVSDSRGKSDAIYKKVTRRLLPFLFVCYVLNFIDRVNISFAHLQFKQDLGFSDASYGLGVGLFFIGYVALEVPSNLLLQKIGARRTIARIMVLWGIVSTSMMLVRTPTEFYIARILLGAAEAGFFPGVVLYLTYWFPAARRARITSILLSAVAVSGIVGGAVSGWILSHMTGTLGLRGWQWLFLLEGIPPIAMGVIALFYLSDRPTAARWLSDDERALIDHNLHADELEKGAVAPGSFLRAVMDPRVYIAALGYMVVPWAGSVLNFWAPSIIQKSGVASVWHIGLLSTVPYLVGGLAMIVIGNSSDRRLERRWHFAGCAFIAAAGIAMLPVASGSWIASTVLLSLATIGYLSAVALFWTIPPAYLSREAAAGGIALVSCLGQGGGLIAPVVVGKITELTGSLALGLYTVVAVLIFGALAILLGIPASALRERREN